MNRSELLYWLAVLLLGRVSGGIGFWKNLCWALNNLQQATENARSMFRKYVMSDRINLSERTSRCR
jgi:ATP-dependent Zn protease